MSSRNPSNPAALKFPFKGLLRLRTKPPRRPGSPGAASSALAPVSPEVASHPHASHSHVVVFEHDDKSCSQSLFDMMQAIPKEGLTLRALLHLLGERGLLMACMIFAIPSLLPIPLPGMSVPQGIVIAMVGLGILLNRSPFLPERALEHKLSHNHLFMILEKGVKLFARIEKLSYPRLPFMTHGALMRSFNGILLVVGALLLGAPFPIPFSNVIPAYGILFLAFGTLQRDGWLVIGGYAMLILTVAYIGLVFFFGAGWIHSLFH
jgi:hypothetical protein